MDKAAVAQAFQVRIPHVIAGFGALAAEQIAQAVLGIGVDLTQAFVGGQHREKPTGPGQLVVRRVFKQLAVEHPDKGRGGLFALQVVALPPALQRRRG